MKIKDIVKVYAAIQELVGTEMPFSDAHTLIMAKKELEPHFTFFADAEKNLVEKFAKRGEDGKPVVNGDRFTIDNEKVPEYIKERNELENVDVDFKEKFKFPSGIKSIKPATLETLLLFFDCE